MLTVTLINVKCALPLSGGVIADGCNSLLQAELKESPTEEGVSSEQKVMKEVCSVHYDELLWDNRKEVGKKKQER